MRLLKKISSVFIALSLMLSVVCFVSANTASKSFFLRSFLRENLENLPIGNPEEYDSNNMPYLGEYPKVVNALSQLLEDMKVDGDEVNTNNKDSLAAKLYLYRIKQNFLELDSRYKNMLIYMAYVGILEDYNFVSGYKLPKDRQLYGPLHFCYMPLIVDDNGKEKLEFYWVDKEECKQTVKQMMDGTFDIKENYFWKDKFKNDDKDLLFLKYTQDAIIKYFGDIDSFFNDEDFCTKFFMTMFEIITNNGKSPGNDQKMISIVSSNKDDAVKDYKKLGHDIIKKSLEYRKHEEGKDYEIEYDETTGYIKSIQKLSNKNLKFDGTTVVFQLMNNILIVACVFLALVVMAVVVILIVILSKKNK